MVSPFEVVKLAALIEENENITLHQFSPRRNPKAPSLDTLELFTLGRRYRPSYLSTELRLQLISFAGQLYLDSHDLAQEMRDWIRMHEGCEEFLEAWICRIRCRGGDISRSHLGKLLAGKELYKKDFDC
jgi:hypothetical protein